MNKYDDLIYRNKLYVKNIYVGYSLKLHKVKDNDVIQKLAEVQKDRRLKEYITDLIRKDIEHG